MSTRDGEDQEARERSRYAETSDRLDRGSRGREDRLGADRRLSPVAWFVVIALLAVLAAWIVYEVVTALA